MTATTIDLKTHSFPTELRFKVQPLTQRDIVDGIYGKYKATIHYEFDIAITQEAVERNIERWVKEKSEKRANEVFERVIMNTAMRFVLKRSKECNGVYPYIFHGKPMECPVMIMTPEQATQWYLDNLRVDEDDDDDDSSLTEGF